MTAKPDLATERERLHAHIRRALNNEPWRITEALATADAIHRDGAGPMQPALDAALAIAQPQQAAA